MNAYKPRKHPSQKGAYCLLRLLRCLCLKKSVMKMKIACYLWLATAAAAWSAAAAIQVHAEADDEVPSPPVGVFSKAVLCGTGLSSNSLLTHFVLAACV
jgi:hypothetical protein